MKRILLLAGTLLASVNTAQADLVCLGTEPGFLMQIDQGQATFDYLGDGTFEILPPINETDILRSPRTMVLLTKQSRIPVRLEPRSCEALETLLPLTIEINVPTSNGGTVFRGCCIIRS